MVSDSIGFRDQITLVAVRDGDLVRAGNGSRLFRGIYRLRVERRRENEREQ